MLQRWRFAWAWFVGATLVAGCGLNPPPAPPGPPEPTPTPPPQACMPEVPWCHDLAPPATCSTEAQPCKHNPTPSPDYCELAPSCPVGPPPPGPPSVFDCDGPVGDVSQGKLANLADEVTAAMAAVYGCSSGTCQVNDSRHVAQRKIIDKLRERGLCAGQHNPGAGGDDYGSDEIAVAVDRVSVREGYHVYVGPASGPGTLLFPPNAVREAWLPAGTQPPPPPPPTDGCSAPLPPKVWTAETLPPGYDAGLLGHTRYIIGCVPHGGVIDCTVQNIRACSYCEAIGMGSYPDGQIRCGCPVRNECPGTFKCEERAACEAYLTGGTVLESKGGAACEFAHGNPFQFKPSDGNCRLCGANGTTYGGERQGCGGWF